MSENVNKVKKCALIKVVVFMAVITMPMLVWGVIEVVGVFSPSVVEKIDYDLGENRTKSKFPVSFNPKTVTTELESYYNDRVPFRSAIITANRKINSAVEKPYDKTIAPFLFKVVYGEQNIQISDGSTDKEMEDLFGDNSSEDASSDANSSDDTSNGTTKCEHDYVVVEVVKPDYEWNGYTLYSCSMCNHEMKSNFTDKLLETTCMPLKVYNNETIEGRQNWLFYNGGLNLEYYKGTNILTEEEMAVWLGKMQKLQEICDEKDIQLLYMLMPTKEQVYPEYMPTLVVKEQYKRVPRFVDYVKNNSDINFIYPLEELLVAKKYWQVYYKHDTHWNEAGGFIGSQAALKALGKETTNLTDIPVVELERAEVGDLINLGNLNRDLYRKDRDYVIAYKPEISEVSSSEAGNEIYRVTSTASNNQRMVMIGDSFRKHTIKYLSKEYAENTFLLRDYLDDEKIQEDIRNADVLIVSANERNDVLMIQSVDKIIEILSK